MKKIGKKSILLAAMMLLLGGAVYVNWVLSGGDLTMSELVGGTSSSPKNLGAAELVGTQVTESQVTVSGGEDDLLTELRLDRTKSRDQSIATLKTVTENTGLSEEERKSAVDTLAQLVRVMEAENDIESLVMAKGFEDCVATVGEENVTVTVRSDKELTAPDAAQIKDIAVSVTNYAPDAIKIVEVG